MNAVDFLDAAGRLPLGSLADITGGGGLLVVAPHPDDESLGCGGLIAAACAAGVATRLVVVSDGAGSHPNSRRYPPPRLRALREEETRRAAAALGLPADAIRFLRLPDRRVPTRGEAADAAIDAIVTAAREIAAGAVCVTWRHDPHCDHAASAVLVDAARGRLRARVFSYPVWGWSLSSGTEVGGPPMGVRFDASRHLAAKAAAIAAHCSQTTDLIDDDPAGFRLTQEMIAHFTGPYELLLEEHASAPGRHESSLPAAYFDQLYAGDPDPWRFASSPYERDKYAETLAALPRPRYASTLEVGCSIGVLTRQLAARTQALCAVDLAAQALEQAKTRCADLDHVRFAQMGVPAQWPAGRFDLIVLSEVVYYLDRRDVAALAERVREAILPGGDIILVHWLGETHYPLSGDEAAELFTASTGAWADPVASVRRDAFRLDILRAGG